jgi:spore coat polysaccharide biosynthesis protein SpsF
VSTAVVLQARLGSRRLPRKVLAPIGRRSLLAHCIARLRASGLPVIVATTDLAEDNAVAREAAEHGAAVFRGSEHDVLARYLGAAHAFDLDVVIRATADNPLVDWTSVGRVLDCRARADADHVIEEGLPIGAAVEAVAVTALARARPLVVDPYDSEHVTPFLRQGSRFRAVRVMAPAAICRPDLRLTVDTAEDLECVRVLHRRLGGGDALYPLDAIIRAAEGQAVPAVDRDQVPS